MPAPFDWTDTIRLDDVPSTMDVAWERLEGGAATGVVVRAEHQSRGRGRRGRVWVAPPGSSLMLSLGFRVRDPARLPDVSRAVALGGLDALREHLRPDQVGLKWPNDILAVGTDTLATDGEGGARVRGKLGGILAESRLGRRSATLVVGLAVNVTQTASDLPPGAISLSALGVDLRPDDLEGPVLERIGARVRVALSGESLLEPWRAALLTLGQRVTIDDGTVEDDTHVWRGVAEDVDPDGGLVVRVGDTLRTVHAGDVTIRSTEPDSGDDNYGTSDHGT